VTAKIEIVQRLGEQALLLPGLLPEALVANDRLKLSLSLLQEAVAHARSPDAEPRSFAVERQIAGLADPKFDAIVSGARIVAGDHVFIPGVKDLVKGLAADLAQMFAPLEAADAAVAQGFDDRLKALLAAFPTAEADQLAVHDIEAMTSARRGGGDSVHLLVMDMHKVINKIAAETAVETLDGARVYHVSEADRASIKAFMAGLNRTCGLAFGHPGLGTTAVRSGARLIIQNDIGTSDAHVLVVHVEDNVINVTYTDLHRQRAKFFIALFEGHDVEWSPLAEHSAEKLGDDNIFYLVTGRYAAEGAAARMRFLEFLGSRIVFLIDWNKARKALQTFVGKDVAVEILNWAAVHDYGHRAFLELGGVDLIFDVIRRAAAGRIPYGARLDEALGETEAANFLRQTLRRTSEGLRARRSTRLIRDEIQADLAQLFDTAQAAALTVLMRHLGVTRMLAAELAKALAEDCATAESDISQLAGNSKRLEAKADRLTIEAREICARVQHSEQLRQAVDEVEDATDVLDEGAFLLSLVPRDGGVNRVGILAELADIVIDSVSNLVRAVEAAAHTPQGRHGDAADALQAIDVVMAAERQADVAEREAIAAFMHAPGADARTLILGLELARALETATDHLAHAALALRDLVLEELSA
jgi:hypothetical protein